MSADTIVGSLAIAAAVVLWAVPMIDAWSADKVKRAVAEALDKPDPIDAHFDTAITEPEFCAETFADLRADWPAWEREVSA